MVNGVGRQVTGGDVEGREPRSRAGLARFPARGENFPEFRGFWAVIRLDLEGLAARVAARFHSARRTVGAPESVA